ncbi:MAG: glycosyltransferase family 4 protein [Acetobacteraceae bacterium]
MPASHLRLPNGGCVRDERMHVLFSIHELGRNGAATALLAQVRFLAAAGHQITVITPHSRPPLLEHFEQAGARVTDQTNWRDHDVAVGCTVFAAPVMQKLLGRLPLVWWFHEGLAGLQYLHQTTAADHLLAAVDRLVFPSVALVERIYRPVLHCVPPGRVEVIPNLVRQPGGIIPADKRAGRVRVLCVGTLCPRKRQGDLVEALLTLSRPDVECVFIGEAIDLDGATLDRMRSAAGQFHLPGALSPEQVHGYYRSADLLCLPSSDEAFALAPLEAASHGVPVVLSDLDAYHSVWRHGFDALLHPVGDVELLAWSLRMLIESTTLHRRLSQAGRAVAARFTEARCCVPFETMLREAIGGRRLGYGA